MPHWSRKILTFYVSTNYSNTNGSRQAPLICHQSLQYHHQFPHQHVDTMWCTLYVWNLLSSHPNYSQLPPSSPILRLEIEPTQYYWGQHPHSVFPLKKITLKPLPNKVSTPDENFNNLHSWKTQEECYTVILRQFMEQPNHLYLFSQISISASNWGEIMEWLAITGNNDK